MTLMSLAAKERYPPVNCKETANYYAGNTEKWARHAWSAYEKNTKLMKEYEPTDFGATM